MSFNFRSTPFLEKVSDFSLLAVAIKFLFISLILLSANLVFADSGCVDSDGDGWGWDGTKTCTCVDPDGDGWGWDGSKSCQVTPEVSISNNSSTSETNCIDLDGDGWTRNPDAEGWGWYPYGSCEVPETLVLNPPTSPPQLPLIQGSSNSDSGNSGFDDNFFLAPEPINPQVPFNIDERFVVDINEDPSNLEDFENYVNDFLTLDPDANDLLDEIYQTNGPVILSQSEDFTAGLTDNGQYVVNFGELGDVRYHVEGASYAPFSNESSAFHEFTHVVTLHAAGITSREEFGALMRSNVDSRLALEQIAVDRTNALFREIRGEPLRGHYYMAYSVSELQERYPMLTIEQIDLLKSLNLEPWDKAFLGLMDELLKSMALGGLTHPNSVSDADTNGDGIISSSESAIAEGWPDDPLGEFGNTSVTLPTPRPSSEPAGGSSNTLDDRPAFGGGNNMAGLESAQDGNFISQDATPEEINGGEFYTGPANSGNTSTGGSRPNRGNNGNGASDTGGNRNNGRNNGNSGSGSSSSGNSGFDNTQNQLETNNEDNNFGWGTSAGGEFGN